MVPWPCFVWWKEWAELDLFAHPGGWEVAGERVGGWIYVRENCQGKNVPMDQQHVDRARPHQEPPRGMEWDPWHHVSSTESSLKQLPIIWRTSVRHLCAPKEFSFSTPHLVVYGSSLGIMHQVLASCIQLRSLVLPRARHHPQRLLGLPRWWKQHLQDLLKSIKLYSSVSCRPALPRWTLSVNEMWCQVLWLSQEDNGFQADGQSTLLRAHV